MSELVLIVEDDPNITKALKYNLELEKLECVAASSLDSAWEQVRKNKPSLILLDVNLGTESGFDFCARFKKEHAEIPVIFITALNDEESVVRGFSVGGNDYIKKPFNNKELIARVRAWLSLSIKNKVNSEQVQLGDVLLKFRERQVFVGSQEVKFKPREYDVLKFLAENVGLVISRDKILNEFQSSEDTFDRTVDTHISHIRRKLREAGGLKLQIRSEYGVGYRLVIDEQ